MLCCPRMQRTAAPFQTTVSIVCAIVILFAVIFGAASCSGRGGSELVIYTYDSMSWIENKVVPAFEAANKCKVRVVLFEDTPKIISRLILEKGRPEADLAIGLTPSSLILAKNEGILAPYKSAGLDRIKDKSLIFSGDHLATPYDYGALAIVYDPAKITPPATLREFKNFPKSIIIEDPRSSSPGTDFLFWTIALYGDGWKDFWKEFRGAVVTAAPGWSEAFTKFENGEAPMMVSYATDGAYAVHNYGESRYKAYIPEGKGFIQIEGVSLVRHANSPRLAKAFIDYMLSDEFQNEIPLNQWMFPVTDVALPAVFSNAVVPETALTIDAETMSKNQEKWITEWYEIMTQ